ncbi:S9 family peptidase [Idiomarina tyrosinivorans]|uniref:prolyl oligopeptidase n=2 Tax=Idiomarina tyrosinivorans TaxID=1445662 RepID=A0A432ZJZ2_9GAMM|nr:S9 family peptidase [Idiomarina tyrosinivorans]
MQYPDSPRGDQTDNYHGTMVADPYRWLEQLGSTSVNTWVEQQNAVSEPYLTQLPKFQAIKQRMTDLWNYEKVSTPSKYGNHYFFYRNNGLQNQSVLYVQDDLASPPRVLIDPNTFRDDGTVSLARTKISPDANYIAYATSDGGSDWTEFYVRDIATGKDLPDHIRGTKFTNVAWRPNETGFYYSRYPLDENGQYDDHLPVAVYYHELGTAQADDPLVYANHNQPSWNPYPQITDDGKYLLLNVTHGYAANAVLWRRLDRPKAAFKPLFTDWDGTYSYITSVGNKLYFRTTANAQTGKLIAVDPEAADQSVETVIAAQQQTLQKISRVADTLFANYLQDAKSRVVLYDLAGNVEKELPLPGIGTVSGFNGSHNADETFFRFSGFTEPGKVYRMQLPSQRTTLWYETQVPVKLDDYQTEQVFYTSTDGTKVPMFIVHKQGIKRTGEHPTLLYGYGGFNISLTPSYSVTRMVWLEMGGVLAIPNLRGGGEYGEAWHQAGTKLHKQQVFDDFIAAAQWLIDNRYTNSDKLAIQGASNGGLLVGATLTQRPDLFAAALPAVGVLDMLRYDTASANAKGWSSDYGLSENADEFAALYAYSPVHNTEPGTCYPATLITTADHDNRVVPWHSYKFAAALQYAQSCDNPILLNVETRAGHGAGTPTWMQIENYAKQWAFLAQQLDIK